MGYISQEEREILNEIYSYNPLLFNFVTAALGVQTITEMVPYTYIHNRVCMPGVGTRIWDSLL